MGNTFSAHLDENEVVRESVALLRRTIIGGLEIIDINRQNQEFLALSPLYSHQELIELQRKVPNPKNKIEEMETMSVSRAIEWTIYSILKRNHPELSPSSIVVKDIDGLAQKVMNIINEKTERVFIARSHRFYEALKKLRDTLSNSLELLKPEKNDLLNNYFESDSDDEQDEMYPRITSLLNSMSVKSKELEEFDNTYELEGVEKMTSKLVFSNGDDEDEEEEDDDMHEETVAIPLSEAETVLMRYVPIVIQSLEFLFEDQFVWDSDFEAWDGKKIQDNPKEYQRMQNYIAYRKMLIYMYANHYPRIPGNKQEKRSWIKEREKFIPHLAEEIRTCFEKISNSFFSNTEGLEDDETGDLKLKHLEQEVIIAEEQRLNDLMHYFTNGVDIESIQQEIDDAELAVSESRINLSEYCESAHTKSSLFQKKWSREIGENTTDYDSVYVFLLDPNFYENIPDGLDGRKSESEETLSWICDMDDILSSEAQMHRIDTLEFEEDEGEGIPGLARMTRLKEFLSLVLTRKLLIYYNALSYTYEKPSDGDEEQFDELGEEIEIIRQAILTLELRINMATYPEEDYTSQLSECLMKLENDLEDELNDFYTTDDQADRINIGEKILCYSRAICDRKQELDAWGYSHIPDGQIIDLDTSECRSLAEGRLSKYIPSDLYAAQKNLFLNFFVYEYDERLSKKENLASLERIKKIFLCRRKTTIFFGAAQKLEDLEKKKGEGPISLDDLTDSDDESTEVKFIKKYLNILNKEIHALKIELEPVDDISDEPPESEFEYQDLYDEAMKAWSEIDGKMAESLPKHKELIDSYWQKIQKIVARFAVGIETAKSTGALSQVPELQRGYNIQIKEIIADIENYLSKILRKLGPEDNTSLMMIEKAQQMREKLFGAQE